MEYISFYTTWCNPCKRNKRVLEETLGDRFARIKLVDAEQNMQIFNKYHGSSVPYTIKLQDGKMVDSHIGLFSREKALAFFA